MIDHGLPDAPYLSCEVRTHTWGGLVVHPCTLVGETRARYRVVFAADARLPGGRIAVSGVPTLVPRDAVRLAHSMPNVAIEPRR